MRHQIGRIAGIDASLKATGLALPDLTFATISPAPSLTGYRRHRSVVQRILVALTDTGVELAIFEDYAQHSPGALALIRAAELQGILRTELTDQGIPFATVPPLTLKKYATDNGRATKDELFDAARAAIGRTWDPERLPINNDEADAYWLRALGVGILERAPEALAHFSKITWPEEVPT
jgi:Holliday junction resolvasome RuvABC endonuclease subunit